ncbi:MAG: transposase, partial [Rhodobacteraceae bacterium]|nr:transposase [Paracoccaceae bacterium]
FEALPQRWVVERTFVWMGRCRLLSRDYQRTLASAQGGGAGNLPVPDAPDCPFDRGNRNGISTIVTYDSGPKAIS